MADQVLRLLMNLFILVSVGCRVNSKIQVKDILTKISFGTNKV